MIRRICEAYDFEIIEMEVEVEHVHNLVSFPPKRSLGDVVRIIKSISAGELFREFFSLKGRLWAGVDFFSDWDIIPMVDMKRVLGSAGSQRGFGSYVAVSRFSFGMSWKKTRRG